MDKKTVNKRLIEVLNKSKARFLSEYELEKQIGLKRSAIRKGLRSFRKMGIVLKETKNRGYQLESAFDVMRPEWLEYNLKTKNFGHKIFFKATVSSTQEFAKRRLLKGAKEGEIFISDKQSKGYGRFERKWESPSGGIWFSLILKPGLQPQHILPLSLVFSNSVASALQSLYGIDTGIKWPNDIWIKSRKIGGILIEMSTEFDTVHYMILGIGINVNNEIPECLKSTATSLNEVVGFKLDRALILTEIVETLEKDYITFLKDGFSVFRNRCWQRLIFKDRVVIFSNSKKDMQVKILELDEKSGYLVTDKGSFSSGEIVAPLKSLTNY